MKRQLYEYAVFPKILPQGAESTVVLRPLSPHTAFNKDERYTVRVMPLFASHDPAPDTTYPSYELQVSADGTLVVRHRFCGEGEQYIRVIRENGVKLADFSVYALEADLYALRPYMGDLHAHTTLSDGKEAPEFVAARYREEGFDFLAITDHRRYDPSLRAIGFYQDSGADLCLVPGEEIHAPGHNVHVVNFGGTFSVNDIWRNDEAAYRAEIDALCKTRELPDGVSAFEVAVCAWDAAHVRKGGGAAIFCHPFWKNNVYQVPKAVSEYLLREGVLDAFELLGGQTEAENQHQLLLAQQLQSEGVSIPCVGNSDSHNTVDGPHFAVTKTILFASECKREALVQAVKSGLSVPVEHYKGSACRVHGAYRLASYAAFLLEEYFPLHNALCTEEGRLMRCLTAGDESAKQALCALSGRTAALLEQCFATV